MLETKRDVRFGVIGCGNIARAHMEALKNGEGIVCAGKSRTPSRKRGMAEAVSKGRCPLRCRAQDGKHTP